MRQYRPTYENYRLPEPLNLSHSQQQFQRRRKTLSATSSTRVDIFYLSIWTFWQSCNEKRRKIKL